jgi:NTP pyrophosphatase (non-canonical NTP hydrolase)
MELKDLQQRVLDLAKEKGWGTEAKDIIFAEKIALIHSEVSETLEAYRQNKIDGDHGVGEELADVILRTMHLAGIYNVDLEKEMSKKMDLNEGRDWSKDQLYIDRDNRAKN